VRLLPPRPRASAANDTQLIPLINIIFLMLIFFMVAGRISAQKTAAPITLPEAALEQAAAEHAVRLEMTREGALLLDGAALENAALPDALARLHGADPKTRLQLALDRELQAADLTPVLGALRASGLAHVELLSTRKGAP
jgi:biopolymer transport protein ExbD